MSLLSHRVLMVTGKGGVGKTVVSAALGLAAAAAGKKVLIVETSGAQRIPALFGVVGKGYTATVLAENLSTLSITPLEAIEDYVIQQIRVRRLFNLVFRNRIVGPFVDAVPGLHDTVQLGKVFDLTREETRGKPTWDLVIVDAPATGHGLTMLNAAKTMMDLTRAGPMYEQVRLVQEVLSDPAKTGLVLVSLPEMMPVSETLDLWQRLGAAREQVCQVVLNCVYPAPFQEPDRWPAAQEALLGRSDALDEGLALTERWMGRLEQQAQARHRLREALPMAPVELPRIFGTPPGPDQLRKLGAVLLGEDQ
ncbi:MAG: anion-transporting ArsA/GET3 family ATPase [Myxococcota bacterium]|jgi:anion-transporting  ArsA/GET3 family ATPase